MADYYLTFKALHLIAVISWMAGLLYLPRLFVYHTHTLPGKEDYDRFLTMERRLLRGIMNPAMMVTFLLGIILMVITEPWHSGWFHAKLTLLFVLAGAHGFMAKCYKEFLRGENRRTEKFYRCFNELPAVLMVIIVLLAVVKPF